jgi:predicted transposase/invertase (TIGR01784 family)
LEGFIPFKWIKDVDFNRMEMQNASFIRKNFRKKESDVIYKLYYKDKPFYLYILLEFQSTVDHLMAMRMLSYEIDLYEEINRKERLKKLPVVFPIMIYNGEDKWSASDNLRDLIDNESREISEFLPGFKYFKVIINEFSKESLVKIRNILSAVFLVENMDENEFGRYSKEIVAIINEEIDEDTKKAFVNWFMRLVDSDRILKSEEIENINDEGVKTMFTKTVERMKEKYLNEGFTKGKIETAKNLKKKGFDIKTIIDVTGLSKKEVDRIFNKNK